jgi:uncharacterized protein (TIGR03435 family)
VLNHSGIQGNFDFLIDYSPDETGNDDAARLLSAIQETGLKLETQPGTIDVIVIDRAGKPSAN